MKQDLKLGLILTVLAVLALVPRFLPKIEFVEPTPITSAQNTPPPKKESSTASSPVKPAATAADTTLPGLQLPVENVKDAEKKGTGLSDALSSVFPDGYGTNPSVGEKAKSRAKPEKTVKPKSPATAKPKVEPVLPPAPAKTFLVDDGKPSAKSEEVILPALGDLPIEQPTTLTSAEEKLDRAKTSDQAKANDKAAKKSTGTKDSDTLFVGLPGLDNIEEPAPFLPVNGKQAEQEQSKTTEIPAAKSTNSAGVAVRNFPVKRSGETGKNLETKVPAKELVASTVSAAKPPIHPYFQRYLDQKQYYVRPGDTLESIAHQLYQDSKMAETLLEYNRPNLSRSSDVRPGITLKLP